MEEPAQIPKPEKNLPSSGAERLQPVRSRTWRACLTCRKRKVKCNGQEPCSYCISSGKICTFQDITDNASLARQQANTIDSRLSRVEDTIQRFGPMVEAFETWLRTLPHNSSKSDILSRPLPFRLSAEGEDTLMRTHSPTVQPPPPPEEPYKPSVAIQRLIHRRPSQSPLSTRSPVDDSNEPPERRSDRLSLLSKDSYGNLRYTGGTSSLMLVDALTSLQDRHAEPSFESVPLKASPEIRLPFFDPNGRFRATEALPRPEDLKYPSAELADQLVSTYFARIHHTFPILHQQLFLERYTAVMEAHSAGKPSGDSAFLSVVFAVFACGACLAERYQQPTDRVVLTGTEFYERAQLLYWMSFGAAQIHHVQCLALMAICNASWNTLAQSWINAGQAIRRAQDLGLHRVTRRPPLTPMEKEIRRRVWWCVYGLDKVLSIALGRPSGTHDDDCNVDYPLELDDSQLLDYWDGQPVTQTEKPSYMTGFVALLRIYTVAGKIGRFVQSTKIDDPNPEAVLQVVGQLDAELEAWSNDLPATVRYALRDTSNPHMISLSLIAFFVYYSSIINLHRPFIPDHLTASTDLTSVSRCLTAARSCIRIGELTPQMLPTSHHLAFAVQYITLSGVLLLRCVLYVTQGTLVAAMIQDAEKCIKILEGMEAVWPASRRCREIVSDLLIVVKTKLYGGASAIHDLRAAQQHRGEVSPEPSRGKRKRSPEGDRGEGGGSTRPRLDGSRPWQNLPQSMPMNGQGSPPYGHRYPEYGEVPLDGRPHQRLSNLRTSMDNSRSPTSPHPPTPQHHHHHHLNDGPDLAPLHHQSAMHTNGMGGAQSGPVLLPPPHEVLIGRTRGYDTPPPQISLDLNAPGREVEGLPFANYDFLGDDLFAVLGNVIKSPAETSPRFEEHSQAIWQAFNVQQEPLFTGRNS